MKQKKVNPRQMTLESAGFTLTQTIKKQIINFSESERNESRTSMSGVKLTATQDETLLNFSQATGFSKSSIISNSLKVYFAFFDQLEKLIRYKGAVVSMLDKLP